MPTPPFINKFQDLTKQQIIDLQAGISKGFGVGPGYDWRYLLPLYQEYLHFTFANQKQLSVIYSITLPLEYGFTLAQILEKEYLLRPSKQ